MAERWTKQSFCASPSGVMKPNPLASLNHFTVPLVRITTILTGDIGGTSAERPNGARRTEYLLRARQPVRHHFAVLAGRRHAPETEASYPTRTLEGERRPPIRIGDGAIRGQAVLHRFVRRLTVARLAHPGDRIESVVQRLQGNKMRGHERPHGKKEFQFHPTPVRVLVAPGHRASHCFSRGPMWAPATITNSARRFCHQQDS